MGKFLQKLMLGGSTAAMVAAISATGALAQGSGEGVEEVVVSASRISIAGYSQPTPVTVVTAQDLERDAKPNLADTLRTLPAVGRSSAPNIAGGGIGGATAGMSTINLRNLGTARTLVLVDNQRVVSSSISGGVDLGSIPSALIERVDVVTGGASASWGSDAVAGVVNVVINKNFTGFKANLEANDSSFDNPSYKEVASWGTDFAGGRGHFIISGSHYDNPVPVFSSDTQPYATQLVVNPAFVAGNSQPYLIHQYIPNLAMQTAGGLINAGPLAGIAFGPNGQPVYFDQGRRFTNPAGGLTLNSIGGTPNPMKEAYPALTSNPYHNSSVFSFIKYNLTDAITASAQFNYSSNRVRVVSGSLESSNAALTLKSDYAYLPPSITALMAANHVTTLPFGSLMLGNLLPSQVDNLTIDDLSQTTLPVSQNQRQMLRGVVALDGAIGSDWSWNAYYQHGTVAIIQHVFNDPVKSYLTNALDAVVVTAANRGSSGLPIGSIACRSTLTAPTNGCQPLNVIGIDVASPEALRYINDGNSDINHDIESQDVVSASMQGVLPWELPAGKVAVAFGGEYRKEAGRLRVAPLAAAAAYANGNANAYSGHYMVEEGFLEVNAPILKDNIVQSLDATAAGRVTNYSTSGVVETWKLGLTSQINSDFRVRSTWSVDIRAPSISNLFSAGSSSFHARTDPKTGINIPLVHEVSGGNPNLKPEVSTTVSAGVVFTPEWIPGLSTSLDWYSISIKKAIYTLGITTVLTECTAGNNYYCGFLRFNGTTPYPGALDEIVTGPANAGSETVSGVDFQADYAMDLFNGSLAWRFIGNYTDHQSTTTAATGKVEYGGAIGPDSTFGGFPKFRSTLSARYSEDNWSATVQGRFIGSAVLNNDWRFNNYVDDNSVPAIAYLDVRASYQWNDNVELYGAMDNVTNVSAPLVASIDTSPFQPVMTNAAIYDAIGREYRIGVRFTY
jgi:outer membrane receptor protein involved in Fe transport